MTPRRMIAVATAGIAAALCLPAAGAAADTTIVAPGSPFASWQVPTYRPSPPPSMRLHSETPGVTFECSLDGRPFAPCVSPVEPAGLADGPHTLEARAVEGGVPDPTPYLQRFSIDGTPPQGLSLVAPAGGVVESSDRPTLRWTPATDATGGAATVKAPATGADSLSSSSTAVTHQA